MSEEFLGFLWIWFDGSFTFVPLGWANFTVLGSELVALNKAENFFDVTANIWVVHGDVANDALWVDDSSATESMASFWHVKSVLLRNVCTKITKDWIADVTKTTFITWSVNPGIVGVDGIDGHADNFAANGLELFISFAESDDFGWANEGEIEWV